MTDYYSKKLSAERLKLCYKLAPPRVQQYFEAEINTVSKRINPSDVVLELGCGYGRVLEKLLPRTKNLFGIDVSYESLLYGTNEFLPSTDCLLMVMDGIALGLKYDKFDFVFCIQNGISAFDVNPKSLIKEALRVTKPGGRLLFSSYSHKFCNDRLKWFELQAKHGLIGEIDDDLTGNGIIVCKDGFRATTFSQTDFEMLTSNLEHDVNIFEVDDSAFFCEIIA